MEDYRERTYLSAAEAARYLGISVGAVHELVKRGKIKASRAASGQMRFDLKHLRGYRENAAPTWPKRKPGVQKDNLITLGETTQRILLKDASDMGELEDDSVHLSAGAVQNLKACQPGLWRRPRLEVPQALRYGQ